MITINGALGSSRSDLWAHRAEAWRWKAESEIRQPNAWHNGGNTWPHFMDSHDG